MRMMLLRNILSIQGLVAVWATLFTIISTFGWNNNNNNQVFFVASFCPSTSSSSSSTFISSTTRTTHNARTTNTRLLYGYNNDGSFPDMDRQQGNNKKPNPYYNNNNDDTSITSTSTMMTSSSYYGEDSTLNNDISTSSSSSSYVTQKSVGNKNKNNKNKNNPRRRWNLNRGTESPFGMSLNAEVWNGRIAQISFVWIFLQELIFGKGILQSLADHDVAGSISLGLFTISVIVLSGRFLAEIPGTALNKGYNDPNPILPSLKNIVNPMIAENSIWSLYNYNDGKNPYGFQKNAEIWNGRLAQLSFVWIVAQEFLQGKPILQSIMEGDIFGLLSLLFFSLTVTTTSSFIKLTAEDDYVERVVGRPALEANANIFRNTNKLNIPYTSPAAAAASESRRFNEQQQYSTPDAQQQQQKQSFVAVPESNLPTQPKQTSWEDSFAASLKAMTSGGTANVATSNIKSTSSDVTSSTGWSSSTTGPSPAPLGNRMSYVESVRVNGSYNNDYSSSSSSSSSSYRSDSKIHPDVDFKFKTATRKLIQNLKDKPPKKKREPTMPISPATAYPVEGFSFKSDVKNMVKPVRNTSPHPEGTFRFSDPYLSRSSSTSTSSTTSTTPPPPPAKVYPVPGFSFKPQVKSMVKMDDTPHPGGTFRFQDKTKVVTNVKPPAAVQVYPVPGFSFKPDVKALIHPDGKFRFQDSTLSAASDSSSEMTSAAAMKVTSPKVLSPPAPVYPVPGFSFKSDVKTLIKKTTDPVTELSGTSGSNKKPTTEARANVNSWPVQGFKFSETAQSLNKESLRTVTPQGSGLEENTVVTTPPQDTTSPVRTTFGLSYLEALSSPTGTSSSVVDTATSWSPATDFEETSYNNNYNDSSSSYYDPTPPTQPESTGWNSPGGSYLDSLNSNTR